MNLKHTLGVMHLQLFSTSLKLECFSVQRELDLISYSHCASIRLLEWLAVRSMAKSLDFEAKSMKVWKLTVILQYSCDHGRFI